MIQLLEIDDTFLSRLSKVPLFHSSSLFIYIAQLAEFFMSSTAISSSFDLAVNKPGYFLILETTSPIEGQKPISGDILKLGLSSIEEEMFEMSASII